MDADSDLWKRDPNMPRLFLVVFDREPAPVWAATHKTFFEVQKHIDSKLEEAAMRGLLLEVSLRFVDPTEAGYAPMTPEGELGKLEAEASE
jgi:hypothetical protein